MANVIALVWDFDKTLVDGYMQDPIFEDKGIDSKEFWDNVNKDRKEKEKLQGMYSSVKREKAGYLTGSTMINSENMAVKSSSITEQWSFSNMLRP